MVPGCLISTTEDFAEVCPCAFGNVRMTVFITIVDVGTAMVVVVLTSTFDSIVISLPFDIAKFLRWRVPVPVVIAVMVLECRSGRSRWWGHDETGRCKSKCKCWNCKSIAHHWVIPPCVLYKKKLKTGQETINQII